MSGRRSGSVAGVIVASLILVAAAGRARADELKTIENPGGGRIVYGSLAGTGVSSLQEGMVYALRKLHSAFGDRPQIGKFFQVRDSHSIATFFSLNATRVGGGIKPISGLVIVTMPPGSQPAAAALYDDSARFAKTGPTMMKTLDRAWRSDSAPAAAPTHQSTGKAQPLRMATAGDRSASIGLAEGWRLTGVAGGQLTAEGPNGEMIGLGVIYQQIHDRPGYGMGGAPLVYPRGGDLFSAFVSVTNQIRRHRGLSQATYKLISSQNLGRTQFEAQVIQVIIEIDLHDGKGPRKGSARLGAMYTPGPAWAISVNASNAPITVADAESATMMAMIRSYTPDARVVTQETNAVIDRIHATARATQIRAEAQSAVNDSRNRAFDAHMDDIDRYSKSFQNYQFDRAQVQDNDRNVRGTVGNGAADTLVKTDPNRFQIVPTQDFIKGVDY